MALALCIGLAAVIIDPHALGFSQRPRAGGVVRAVLRSADVDSIDPALSYGVGSFSLVDTTCARLLAYTRTVTPRLEPEVATAFPRVSRDLKTYTFTLRGGFRFSDGAPVRANAFARAINRTLAPAVKSPWPRTHAISPGPLTCSPERERRRQA